MPRSLEFWFDFSCPYAYLASTRVEGLAEETGARLLPKPMLLGGVFRAHGIGDFASTLNAAKARHNMSDMRRHAALLDLPLQVPNGHPLRTVTAMRALLSVGEPFMPLAHKLFEAYWVEGVDISTDEGIGRVLGANGHDPRAVLDACRSQDIKDELRRRTDQAVTKGVFGAPTFIVDGELFWGQDRMDLVQRALGGAPEPFLSQGEEPFPTDFYFDYSSPYAYLASRRVTQVLGPSVSWRPMLLGAVFKALQTANVPILAQCGAKQKHTVKDLERQAEQHGAPFTWPSRFPMNSVLPLRATLLADAHRSTDKALVHRLYRAYWVEDRDISNPEVVAFLCDDVGLDGRAIVENCKNPNIKDALRKHTQQAIDAGVFGAPTFLVHPSKDRSQDLLYWGADRLVLASRAAAGDRRAW